MTDLFHPLTGVELDPENELELHNALVETEGKIGRLYNATYPIKRALADVRGIPELPPARARTPKQDSIARCASCGRKHTLES